MEKGLEQSKRQLQAIITQVQTFLDMHQVISAGPFLYAFMEEVILYVKERTVNFCHSLFMHHSYV